MLTVTKSISLTGTTQIDGKNVERHTAVINSENPESMTMNVGITLNRSLSEENLETCRAERNEFEDMAIALKNELLAAKEEEDETEV